MKRDYDKLLESGNKAQLEKLLLNEHKRGFENINLDYAINRIYQEIEELHEAHLFNDVDFSSIRKEAADIANFAHMIIFKCDQELNK